MRIHSSPIEDLPSALGDELAQRLVDSQPAAFLDYDGTLTPYRDRPQNATISPRMRNVVSSLPSAVRYAWSAAGTGAWCRG